MKIAHAIGLWQSLQFSSGIFCWSSVIWYLPSPSIALFQYNNKFLRPISFLPEIVMGNLKIVRQFVCFFGKCVADDGLTYIRLFPVERRKSFYWYSQKHCKSFNLTVCLNVSIEWVQWIVLVIITVDYKVDRASGDNVYWWAISRNPFSIAPPVQRCELWLCWKNC